MGGGLLCRNHGSAAIIVVLWFRVKLGVVLAIAPVYHEMGSEQQYSDETHSASHTRPQWCCTFKLEALTTSCVVLNVRPHLLAVLFELMASFRFLFLLTA